jgi:hypothetical protein
MLISGYRIAPTPAATGYRMTSKIEIDPRIDPRIKVYFAGIPT